MIFAEGPFDTRNRRIQQGKFLSRVDSKKLPFVFAIMMPKNNSHVFSNSLWTANGICPLRRILSPKSLQLIILNFLILLLWMFVDVRTSENSRVTLYKLEPLKQRSRRDASCFGNPLSSTGWVGMIHEGKRR